MLLSRALLAYLSVSFTLLSTPAAAQQPVPGTPVPAAPPSTPVPVAPPTPPSGAAAIRGSIQICPAGRGEHRIRMEAGRRYVLTATSQQFDPRIRLIAPGNPIVLAEDDDSGGGVTPRLAFTAPQTGDYLVQVGSAGINGAGAYDLSVTPAGPLPALITRPSRMEPGQRQVFEGNLAAGGSENGRRFNDYQLRLAPGETAMLHVQSAGGPDTMLQVFRAAERGGRPIAEDDDGGGGTDPFLFFAPTAPGDYVVRVIGADEAAQGSYRLRIIR